MQDLKPSQSDLRVCNVQCSSARLKISGPLHSVDKSAKMVSS